MFYFIQAEMMSIKLYFNNKQVKEMIYLLK